VRSLAISHPQLAQEWHTEKNGHLTPDAVKAGSNKSVWWRCPVNPRHVWSAVIAARVDGKGCPVCVRTRASLQTSLAVLNPDVAREWHSKKNGALTPEMVRPGSGERVWWLCRVNPLHEWEAEIRSRVSGSGCPGCAATDSGEVRLTDTQ